MKEYISYLGKPTYIAKVKGQRTKLSIPKPSVFIHGICTFWGTMAWGRDIKSEQEKTQNLGIPLRLHEIIGGTLSAPS